MNQIYMLYFLPFTTSIEMNGNLPFNQSESCSINLPSFTIYPERTNDGLLFTHSITVANDTDFSTPIHTPHAPRTCTTYCCCSHARNHTLNPQRSQQLPETHQSKSSIKQIIFSNQDSQSLNSKLHQYQEKAHPDDD